eukprot:3306412-Rhodomonas_salina.1
MALLLFPIRYSQGCMARVLPCCGPISRAHMASDATDAMCGTEIARCFAVCGTDIAWLCNLRH